MVPEDIGSVIVNGQVVYFKQGEVIAIGEAARDFVLAMDGSIVEGEEEGQSRVVPRSGAVSRRPSSYVLEIGDPLAVVQAARARGLRVQPNHVLVSHCGCQGDPCCGRQMHDRTRANPFWANPFWANPFWANPFWANGLVRSSAVPTDSQALRHPAPGPVDEARLASQVTVWVLDTGISDGSAATPLDGRGVKGGEGDRPDRVPTPSDGLVDPVAGHGTFIAGIIEELAPGCDIDVRNVIEPEGLLIESVAHAQIYDLLASEGDRSRTILNLSFGGALYDPSDSALGDAIAAAKEAGVVVVASAGNEMSCLPVYPANFPGVVAVGAVDRNAQPAEFTNVGSWVQACALGVEVTSTFFTFDENAGSVDLSGGVPEKRFKGWAVWSGTSFAAPVVVGAIAQKLLGNVDANFSAAEALAEVLSGGTPIDCLGVYVEPDGAGRLAPGSRPLSGPG